MTAATHQVVNGLVAGFADDVPERDLDGGYGAHVKLRALRINVADEALGDGLDLKRIHADDERLQFVDGGFHGLGEVVDSPFPDAVNAFVG